MIKETYFLRVFVSMHSLFLTLLPRGIIPRRERVDLSMVRVTWSSLRVASSIEPLGKCAKSGGNPGVHDRSGCSFQSEVVPDWCSGTEVRSRSGQPAQFEVRTPYRTGGRGRSRCGPRFERLRKILPWDIVSL